MNKKNSLGVLSFCNHSATPTAFIEKREEVRYWAYRINKTKKINRKLTGRENTRALLAISKHRARVSKPVNRGYWKQRGELFRHKYKRKTTHQNHPWKIKKSRTTQKLTSRCHLTVDTAAIPRGRWCTARWYRRWSTGWLRNPRDGGGGKAMKLGRVGAIFVCF